MNYGLEMYLDFRRTMDLMCYPLAVLNLIKDACKINYLDTKKFFATSNLLQILKKRALQIL